MTEHKSYPIDEFKALDEEGTFEGLVAVFGNVDYGGDIVQKGAFSASLKEWEGKSRSIPVLWSHDADLPPIGVVQEAKEDTDGLRIKAKLLVNDNPQAKAIHAAMKAGALAEFSFGYSVNDFEKAVHEGQTVRKLKALGLHEVSPVFRGMNPATQLEGVKSIDDGAALTLVDKQNALIEDMMELSEKHADVALKALADSLTDVVEKFDAEVKAGEQEDNPEPNDSNESEEAKARIRQLQAEKPIHLLGGNDESEAESLEGKLAELNQQISEKDAEVKSLWTEFEQCRDQFAQAGNDANATDSDEFKKAEDVHKRYASAAADKAGLENVRSKTFEMLAIQGEGGIASRAEIAPQEYKSLSQRALESPEYKGLKDSGALHSDKRSFVATLAEMSNDEVKALITGVSDTSAGAFIINQRAGYVEQPKRPPTVLNLVTMGETSVDAIEYARQTTFTNVAVETAEATSTTTGTKPEATIAFEKVTETVKTIAHWVPATRRALDDESQLRTIIDSQLRYGLEFRLESQIIAGDATGENLRGILNTSNILTQAKGSDTVADAVHKAITQIRLGFVEPNGIALHPDDWQDVRLLRDGGGSVAGSGTYLYGPPSDRGATTMWGLPTVVSAAVTSGTGIVGDYTKAVLWMREGAQVLATDSHSDFFVKNLVAVLAELRAAFGVLLPQAFCKVTGI